MPGIKALAKDTAIYGLSSIVGRFLNWCLVPLYTIMFATEAYGVVTLVYSVVALALIILTYGMETGFFRFANHERWHNPMEVYSTALISLGTSSTAFFVLVLVFLGPCTDALQCQGHPSYVWMMALAVAVDAFTALPFSYLRYKRKAVRFAYLRLINIGINIGLNLWWILLCPWLVKVAPAWMGWYDPSFGIGYIFLANLVASLVTLVMLIPELKGFPWLFNPQLWREMLRYSAPLLVLGVAGIMNQTIDKILYPYLATGTDAEVMSQLGIYGANYKIAIVMVMFTQAFRFAYEPFIFAQNRERGDNRLQAYRDAMKGFIILALLIFMGVMFYLPILKYFISPRYFAGLAVVPIIMAGEVFFGIFFNLSLWYKLTDHTVWGMYFSLIGLAVTLALNVLLVPVMGYIGCAWAAFACYGVMMVTSFFVGKKKYPIGYPLSRIGLYVIVAALLYVVGMYGLTPYEGVNMVIRTVLLLMYAAFIVYREYWLPRHARGAGQS